VSTDTGSAASFESACDLFECVAVDVMTEGSGAMNVALKELE
jgi:hypothetical protein